MNGNGVRSAGMAVVGLDTTIGGRPLIVQAAVYHLAGMGQITAGPLAYPVAVEAPLTQVPVRLWPKIRAAPPPWVEVAGRLLGAVDGRAVVVHDRTRWQVLCRQLPGWQPAEVLFTREVAQRWWPGLASYDLDSLLARATRYRRSRVGPDAVAEAHAVAVVLAALLPAMGRAAPERVPPARTGVVLAGSAPPVSGGAPGGQGSGVVRAAGGRWPGTRPADVPPGQPETPPNDCHPSNADPGQLGGPAPVNSLVQPGQRDSPDKATWQHAEMRSAVQVRNFTAIYRLLQKQGYSQQRIAALTGQSQPEVSAIIHGRKVQAYDVMLRIVDGLGIPRGLAGFATCTCTDTEPDVSAPAT